MTCDEFRDRWLDREPGDIAPTGGGHAESCEGCRVWERRYRQLDDRFGAALVTTPPPELVARLAAVPQLALAARVATARSAPAADPWAWGVWVETILVALIALAALTFTGFDPFSAFAVVETRFGDVIQALPLIFNGPLLSYFASIAFTVVEAGGTLILIALGLLQVSPDLFGTRGGATAENG